MSRKKKQVRNVVPTIYIIEVITPTDGTYYKVGFTDVDDNSRPNRLIKEYSELHPDNKARLVKTFILPTKKGCYFNDDMVRDELTTINFGDIRAVNPSFIAQIIGVDGKNEFVEVLDPTIKIADKVEEAINSLAKNKDNYKYNIRNILVYDNDTPHLVTENLIDIIERFNKVRVSCYTDKTILLIGQYEPQWLAAIASHNFVYVLTDEVDMRPVFKYNYLNSAINYVNNIEEIKNMNIQFDLIISNPPYNSIGANITDEIIQHVNYTEFINLLPANDYKRNKTKDLFKYQSDMEAVNDGFEDAAVTTHIARIHKTKVNNMTLDSFERSQYIDRSLDRYFEENSSRTHYAIDNSVYKPKLATFEKDFDLRRCLFIGKRYISDEHLPYSKDSAGYKVNKERLITPAELIAISAKSEQDKGNVGDFILTQFDTVQEQNNITDFLYSRDGFRFFAKVLVAMNADSYCHVKKFLPKVDWNRSWTVEEILDNYGYKADEIAEIMADLNNFKFEIK